MLLTRLLVKALIGVEADLVTNHLNHSHSLLLLFGVEMFGFPLLIALVLVVVDKKCLICFGGTVIGLIVG